MSDGRPPHPLFGGTGGNNMLAEAAKKMEQKRMKNPYEDPRPSNTLMVANDDRSSSNRGSLPHRPPHPLTANGGAGGNQSLNNEILAMAAKRSARVNDPQNEATSAEDTEKKQVQDVSSLKTASPLNTPTASLAEQVAFLANQRKSRLNGDISQEEGNASSQLKMRPIAPEPLAPPPRRPKATQSATTTSDDSLPASSAPSEPKKKGWFARTADEPIKAKDYSDKKDATSPAPAFQHAQLRKAEASPLSPTTPSSPPTFSKAKLKPTGISLTETKVEETIDEALTTTQPSVGREKPTTVHRIVKDETPAPPSQKTRTVTQSETTFEVTEYKCACVIL